MHVCRFARRRLVELNRTSCSFGPTVTSPLSAADSSVLGNGSETTDVFVDWLSRNGNYPALVCGLSLGLGGGTDKKSRGGTVTHACKHALSSTSDRHDDTEMCFLMPGQHAVFPPGSIYVQSQSSAVSVFIQQVCCLKKKKSIWYVWQIIFKQYSLILQMHVHYKNTLIQKYKNRNKKVWVAISKLDFFFFFFLNCMTKAVLKT